ncbi:unnamed protein product [Soboliphyme baturini]|uniref:DUF3408 domain-containing protein n=1 Tax=Soboliphyme baturini TaxID=241478 RepID=A0A183I9Q7_9BILA|nr:unnamed protein product [Soboliphyme baturini]
MKTAVPSLGISVSVAEDPTVRSSLYQESFSDTSAGNGDGYRNHMKLSPVQEGKIEHFSPSEKTQQSSDRSAEPQYVYQNAEEEAPRAQVIGSQEIYKDPRQERLKSQKPFTNQIEGEKLSFKDKMRLFAKEIGESTPKERVRVSSAQRIIEQSLNV